ncbi:spore cortex biosynthesis protein YabQ [Wansuia hejianensis]|uniref:Spore cortex biosynthesis protein YabQ n=1 Tax=Wansuia hejianensis TaxID=2763667 RepID=A0A926F1A5_9FIRM|nr:spore cortex biosynthesis protein YabQ [Wansuia hejianensis]MBC8591242.1 hypothetical protein [Wansuia hejianensis]
MLEINLIDEFYIFLISINYGLIVGVIYDLFRVLRHYSKPSKLVSLIEDLILWVIITIIFFIFLVKNTDGVIRGFIIIGFIVGCAIYLKIISKYNFPLLIKVFRLILNLINEIIKLIVKPFRMVNKYVRKKLKRWSTLLKTVFKETKKYAKLISKKK